MTTIENISREILLLDGADEQACSRVSGMLTELAVSPGITGSIREIAVEAAALCQSLSISNDPDDDLKRLSRLIDCLREAGTGETPDLPVLDPAFQRSDPSDAPQAGEEASPRNTKPEAADSESDAGAGFFALPDDVDMDLIREFQTEAEEHIGNAEVALMTLDTDPSDTDSIHAVFRAFHTMKGVASFINLDYIITMAHKAESFLDRVRKGELEMVGALADLAFEALDMLKGLILSLGGAIEDHRCPVPPNYHNLLHRLQHPDEYTSAISDSGEVGRRSVGGLPVENQATEAAEVTRALRAQQAPGKPLRRSGDSTTRISTARVDNLIHCVGELVIAQSMVNQDPIIQDSKSRRLVRNVSQLSKITRSLQELALSMRMVSVKATFQRMARLVRDLARKSGKDVSLEVFGEDTELDRNMVEAIADPLVHMIRNAVDHGLEAASARTAAGKRAQGQITLTAAHEGGFVVITLADDGKGLDREKIMAKAVERKLIEPGTQLSDHEIHNLVFAPGFSTAERVTDVSGRGVGMDVVRTNIEKLRGSIEITSESGKGSSFKIRLPLTPARRAVE